MKKALDVILGYTQKQGSCLVWQRAANTDGYARALINGDANAKVHRVVFELVNGFNPPVVRHTCDNPLCINPDHLISGTQADNVADRKERGRSHKHVPPELVDKVCSLREKGLTYKRIASTLDINYKRVEYIMNKFIKLHK